MGVQVPPSTHIFPIVRGGFCIEPLPGSHAGCRRGRLVPLGSGPCLTGMKCQSRAYWAVLTVWIRRRLRILQSYSFVVALHRSGLGERGVVRCSIANAGIGNGLDRINSVTGSGGVVHRAEISSQTSMDTQSQSCKAEAPRTLAFNLPQQLATNLGL